MSQNQASRMSLRAKMLTSLLRSTTANKACNAFGKIAEKITGGWYMTGLTRESLFLSQRIQGIAPGIEEPASRPLQDMLMALEVDNSSSNIFSPEELTMLGRTLRKCMKCLDNRFASEIAKATIAAVLRKGLSPEKAATWLSTILKLTDQVNNDSVLPIIVEKAESPENIIEWIEQYQKVTAVFSKEILSLSCSPEEISKGYNIINLLFSYLSARRVEKQLPILNKLLVLVKTFEELEKWFECIEEAIEGRLNSGGEDRMVASIPEFIEASESLTDFQGFVLKLNDKLDLERKEYKSKLAAWEKEQTKRNTASKYQGHPVVSKEEYKLMKLRDSYDYVGFVRKVSKRGVVELRPIAFFKDVIPNLGITVSTECAPSWDAEGNPSSPFDLIEYETCLSFSQERLNTPTENPANLQKVTALGGSLVKFSNNNEIIMEGHWGGPTSAREQHTHLVEQIRNGSSVLNAIISYYDN